MAISSYPIGLGLEEQFNYYHNLDSSIILPNELPDNIIRKSKKENLIIIGNDKKKLKKIFTIFPMGFYNLVSIVPYDEANQHLLDPADRILIVDDDGRVNSYLETTKQIQKKITFEDTTLPNIGNVTRFNFGSINSDKNIIVMKPSLSNGLLWNLNGFVRIANYFKNYICYADLQNYPNQHMPPSLLGLYDPWIYYFKQFSNYSCDEVYHSKSVYIVPNNILSGSVDISRELISDTIKNKEEKIFKELKMNPQETLGVFMRGSDYAVAKWHPVPFDPYETICVIDYYLKDKKIKNIFVDTEDQYNICKLEEHYGDKVLYLKRERFNKEPNLKHATGKDYGLYGFKVGEDYLIETLLVSRCFGVIATDGTSGGAIKKFGKANINFYDTILTKNKRDSWGPNPLTILKRGNNVIYSDNFENETDTMHVCCTDNRYTIMVHSVCNKIVPVTGNIKTNLKDKTKYFFTVESDNQNIKDGILLSLDDGSKLFHSNSIVYNSKASSVSIMLKMNKNNDYNGSFTIQLKEGSKYSKYEPPSISITQIPVRDSDNLYYKPECVKSISLKDGIINVCGVQKVINKNDYELIKKIMTYDTRDTFYEYDGESYSSPVIVNSKYKNEHASYDTWFFQIPYKEMTKDIILEGVKALLRTNNWNLIKEALEYLQSNTGQTSCCIALARYYNDFNFIDPVKHNTIYYYREAIKIGSEIAENELFDTLYKLNNPDYYAEMLSLIEKRSELGIDSAKRRLASLYRTGKGVDINLRKAAMLLQSINNHIWLDDLVLFDTLYLLNDPNDYEEMYNLILKYEKNPEGELRLGRMYRDGKGVEKNIKKSIAYFKLAYDGGLKWCQGEYKQLLQQQKE